jgi:hypothetical protein
MIGRAALSFQGMPDLLAVHVIVSQNLESSNRSQDGVIIKRPLAEVIERWS